MVCVHSYIVYGGFILSTSIFGREGEQLAEKYKNKNLNINYKC